MYLFINALILALLLPASGAHVAEAGPTCRAELKGLNLLTIIELPSGVAVEGPWRITPAGEEISRTRYNVVATLDHVVEKDGLTGDRQVIPFPQPVRLAFRLPERLVFRLQVLRLRADWGAGSSIGRLPGQSSCRRTA